MTNTKTWYVLSLTDRSSELIRCTPGDFRTLDFKPGATPKPTPEQIRDRPVQSAREQARYTPAGAGLKASDQTPRATKVVDDPVQPSADTESFLRNVASEARTHLKEEPGPLFVAMDDPKWAIFQAVSGFDQQPRRLDATTPKPSHEQLWELSRTRIQS